MEKKYIKDLIKIFDSVMEELRGNPYVAFLMFQKDIEIGRVSDTNAVSTQNNNAAFDIYEIMWLATVEKIQFIKVNTADNSQFAEHVMGIFTGPRNAGPSEAFGNPDQSWMLKRIATLKKEFAENLNKIGDENGIPFHSVAKMYHLLVYCMAYTEFEDDILSQYPDASDDFWQIQVPEGLSDARKEDIVEKVWGKIRKLFIECIHVFIFTGALETLYLTALYQKDGLETTKTRLLLTAVDKRLADTIRAINTETDLQEFFRNNLFCFIDSLINIAESFKRYIDLAAFKKMLKTMVPIAFDPHFSNIYGDQDIKTENKEFAKEQAGNDDSKRKNSDKKSKNKADDDRSNEFARNLKAFKLIAMNDFSHKLTTSTGMVQTYELRGDPLNFVKYIQRSFNNLTKKFYSDHLAEVTKAKCDMSKRQLNRYNNNLKKGDYDYLLTGEDRKSESIYELINDGNASIFREIRNIENFKLQHRKPGHLSQNQLISQLSAPIMENFILREFKPPNTPQRLLSVISSAGYAVPEELFGYNDDLPEEFSYNTESKDMLAVELINLILETCDFADGVIRAMPELLFSNEVKNLISKTQPFRKLEYFDLSDDEKRSIKSLNRLILEEVHSDVTPRGSRSNFFSKEYGIDFVDISRSTYITILRKLISDGKLQVIKEGQTNYYPVDRQYIANVARLISEHQKNKRNKKSVS